MSRKVKTKKRTKKVPRVSRSKIPDWKEEAQKWGRGDLIESIKMRNFCPSYEQAAQIFLWEIMLRWKGKPPKEEVFIQYIEHTEQVAHDLRDTLREFDVTVMHEWVATTAWYFMTSGYDKVMSATPEGKKLWVTKRFPVLNV